MRTAKTLSAPVALLSIGLACLCSPTEAATANTFQLQMRSTMSGASTGAGPQGWSSSRYVQTGLMTNQTLQVSCRGLASNQVYHLLGSVGTNGQLMHLSDFMPTRSGMIMMQYLAGMPHHFAGTNNPGQAWGMMGGWTNHMSWVLFPGNNANWCNGIDEGSQQSAAMGNMGDNSGMGGSGHMTGPGGQGMTGPNGGSGGMGGVPGGAPMGGMGQMGGGWPAMANWQSGMTNWWSTMASWCWNYTNMWNVGFEPGGGATNWRGNLGHSAYHQMPMPDGMGSLPALNGLVVMDQNLQPVLSADMANPDTFGYQVRCTLSNTGIVPGAKATLQASATSRTSHFALRATGLAPSTSYFMDIDGVNVTPVATDRHGRLQIRKLPEGVTSLRGIGSVSLEDNNRNTILSATLLPH